jgi:hypothetical protein
MTSIVYVFVCIIDYINHLRQICSIIRQLYIFVPLLKK